MHHPTVVALAVVTLGTATVAAVYWFKSAAVDMPQIAEPIASISDAPEQHVQISAINADNVRNALLVASELNKKAAIWTGVSALLGALATVAGTIW